LMKLFESEVPEIADGIVEIRAVAREPGMRAKIAVVSNDDKVDPVGACVGIKGSRVQAIVRELNGERIDIVPWSADPIVYVGRALSPAKVKQVQVSENGREMRVVVEDDQLSLAIGKGGQNARLAAKLTGMKIDLLSEGEERRRNEAERLMRIEVESLPGVGEKVAESLIKAGIETAADLAAASLLDLMELPGIGAKTAEKLLALAREAVAQRAVEVEAEMRQRTLAARAAAEAEADLEGGADAGAMMDAGDGAVDDSPALVDAAVGATDDAPALVEVAAENGDLVAAGDPTADESPVEQVEEEAGEPFGAEAEPADDGQTSEATTPSGESRRGEVV
jgi:transcription termination/antitermination protein NusA